MSTTKKSNLLSDNWICVVPIVISIVVLFTFVILLKCISSVRSMKPTCESSKPIKEGFERVNGNITLEEDGLCGIQDCANVIGGNSEYDVCGDCTNKMGKDRLACDRDETQDNNTETCGEGEEQYPKPFSSMTDIGKMDIVGVTLRWSTDGQDTWYELGDRDKPMNELVDGVGGGPIDTNPTNIFHIDETETTGETIKVTYSTDDVWYWCPPATQDIRYYADWKTFWSRDIPPVAKYVHTLDALLPQRPTTSS